MAERKVEYSKEQVEQINRTIALFKKTFDNDSGKEVMKTLREGFVDKVDLPISAAAMQEFGSVEVYLGFMQGQRNIVLFIEKYLHMKEIVIEDINSASKEG